jgi:hypothetical protein
LTPPPISGSRASEPSSSPCSGSLALLLAVIGLYGVKAYSVTRRTREIGNPHGHSAPSRATLQRMILREGLVMTVTGAVLGLLLAFGLGRLCAGMLYDCQPDGSAGFQPRPRRAVRHRHGRLLVAGEKGHPRQPAPGLRSE